MMVVVVSERRGSEQASESRRRRAKAVSVVAPHSPDPAEAVAACSSRCCVPCQPSPAQHPPVKRAPARRITRLLHRPHHQPEAPARRPPSGSRNTPFLDQCSTAKRPLPFIHHSDSPPPRLSAMAAAASSKVRVFGFCRSLLAAPCCRHRCCCCCYSWCYSSPERLFGPGHTRALLTCHPSGHVERSKAVRTHHRTMAKGPYPANCQGSLCAAVQHTEC
jgi:hypothetical protein